MNLISKNKKNEGYVSLLEIPETVQKNDKIYLQLIKKWKLRPITHVLCDSSVTVNQKEGDKGKKNNEFYKRNFNKIDNDARQIMKGTYGHILDKLNH